FQHDALDVACPVLERDLLARELLHLAFGIHHRDFRDDFREFGAMAAGVHVDAAADRPRNPHKPFDADEPGFCGTARQNRLAHAAPAGAAVTFSPVAFSCHSCRLLTLPVRLRSAMIASHAALAADIVVVYGTRCTNAARRMA